MNDNTSPPADEQAAGPRGGERLSEARRLRQISLPDIARELHLDEPKVQALEENRFDVLGAPVFARGHLRKYAELVGVPVGEIMTDYQALTNMEQAPPIVGEPRQVPREINLLPWLIGLPILLLVLGAAYWWLGRVPAVNEAPPPVSQPLITRQPVLQETAPGTATQTADQSADDGVDDVPAAEVEPEVAARAAAPESAELDVPSGELALALSFTGDCWTEVTDASGNRLFFDLGRRGRTVNVTGTPPFRVLLGDSNNVTLRVNGEVYPLSNAERRGDTARLTVP